MAHPIVKMMTMIVATLAFVFPATSIEPHVRKPSKIFESLMCEKYDPQAVAENIQKDSAITKLCDMTTNQAKCIDFMGNQPNADPSYAIKSDVKVVSRYLETGSLLAMRTEDPELKPTFTTCSETFNKVVKILDDVVAVCDEKVTKLATQYLEEAVSELEACDKAYEGCKTEKIQKYTVKDKNDNALDAIKKILAVAKQYNE